MRSNSAMILLLVTFFGNDASQAQAPILIHRQKYAMGAVFEIAAYSSNPDQDVKILDEALQEAVRLDHVMSNFQPDSELSILNRAAYYAPQPVSPDLFRVLAIALDYSRRSEGKFDITVGPLMDYWKAVTRGERKPSAPVEATLRRCIGYRNVVLLHARQVAFSCPSLGIDLGAIGKGYAVDAILKFLREHSVMNALINAGGSTLYGMGSPPNEQGWSVDMKGSGEPQHVVLHDDSISTSEQSAPSVLGERLTGHILDPKSGRPLSTTAAVSAFAPTATDSDALSTTMFLLGPEKGRAVIESMPGTAAIWIYPSGQMKTVSNTTSSWLLSGPREKQEAQK
jgi:thiamine biosynthesis lipoprotein